MADTNQLLEKIGNLIDQKLEPVKKDLQDVKQGQSRLEQGQAQTNTALAQTNSALEAVKAGQDDLKEKVANLPTRPEFQDFRADIGRKVQDHESRIEELEKEAGIPHPHKH